jgi:hypothetical protein
MRVYLDNQLVTYMANSLQKKVPGDRITQQETSALATLASVCDIEFLVSEEVLAEIGRLRHGSPKRQDLERMYWRLKTPPVIRNSSVAFDDLIATFDSPDVFFDHAFTDTDLDAARNFLRSKGNHNDFDARYVANAMLPANKIDVFLTADRKSLWNHREDIKATFGVSVKLPSELAAELTKPGGPLAGS